MRVTYGLNLADEDFFFLNIPNILAIDGRIKFL